MVNKISTIFDFKEQGGGLKKIKADVMSADTATGKFKAGWAGAMDSVKSYGVEAAAVAGTAILALGKKSMDAFTNGAIAAGQFSAATGATTEEASKWIAAADDLGISGDLVQKAFQKANKEVAEGGPIMEQYGISVVRAADGTVDANETFLKTIDIVQGIVDPTERARVAQELFGRSYGDVAELIFQDADKLRSALDATSEAQIFDEDEVRKAREYRAAMDRLADAGQDLALVLGEAITPAVSDLANDLAGMGEAVDDLRGALDVVPGPLKRIVEAGWQGMDRVVRPWKLWGDIVGDNTDKTNKYVDSLVAGLIPAARAAAEEAERGVDASTKARDAATEQEAAHRRLNASYDDLGGVTQDVIDANADHYRSMGELDGRYDDVVGAVEEATASYADQRAEIERVRDATNRLHDANLAAIGGEIGVRAAYREARSALSDMNDTLEDSEASTDDQAEAVDRATQAQLDAASAATEWAASQAAAAGQSLNAEQKTRIYRDKLAELVSVLAPGSPLRAALQGYLNELNAIPTRIDTAINLRVTGQTVTRTGDVIGVRPIDSRNTGRRAAGGPVAAGGLYEVGEGGKPELLEQNGRTYLIPGNNGEVVPASAGSGGAPSSGGGNVYVSVDARGAIGLNGLALERYLAETLRKHARFNGRGVI